MHFNYLLLLFGTFAAASPQQVDLDAIIAAGPPPDITYATKPTIIKINPTVLASEAAAAITASPLSAAQPATSIFASSASSALPALPLYARQVSSSGNACATRSALPRGAGPVPSPDTASAFLGDAYFSSVANAASIPTGYSNTFTNLQAENQAYGYLGYSLLSSYDTQACAKQCNSIFGCMAINILFERDPSVDPGTGCSNPSSTTLIKCVFWGSPVSDSNAINTGQWRDDFQVVIAGSNGYVSETYPSQLGYSEPTFLNNASINALYDCNGAYTFMGYVSWNDGKPFDAGRCGAACTAQSDYNTKYPPADGSTPMTCQIFNTYLLLNSDQVQAQVCALYTETWNETYATNTGYFYLDDVYTIEASVTYSNSSDPGVCMSVAY